MRLSLKSAMLGAGVLCTGAASAQDASPPAAMPAIASNCLSCHGANGRPALADVPIIAGQQELYLVNALKAYRDGGRAAGQALVMHELTRDLSDADIATLAKWFGGQN